MLSLRITAPDGTVRTIPLDAMELTIGRAPDNTIVLETGGVSSHHCAILVTGHQAVIEDRGSTNGTFVNNAPVQRSNPLGSQDRIYVGQYLLQVNTAAGVSPHNPTAMLDHSTREVGQGAGILMQREDRGWRDEHARISRAAEQWAAAGRTDQMTLRPHELQRAEAWLKGTPADRRDQITALQREIIEASRGANTRRAAKRVGTIAGGMLVLGGLVAAAVVLWPEPEPEPAPEVESKAKTEKKTPQLEPEPEPEPALKPKPKGPSSKIKKQIDHAVVPQETLDDIAQRYGVTVADIAKWNLLNPDQPGLSPGDIVKIKKPTKRPLPQQKINYELEKEDSSWSKLSARFGVSAMKLRAYNPGTTKLKPGEDVTIWIDPKPYAPKLPRQKIPDFVLDKDAQAIGSPNSGSLENAVQIPHQPALYKRRYEYIMWGSGYLVSNVQKAVAQFRQDMDFDGTLVLADVSKKKGGHFNPHKSHQTGRDIDIWLPTVRGVFKEKYLTKDGDEKWGRRPNPEEADWFATWGLVRALIDTGAVQDIFLDHSIQPNVYNAAKFLGVSDEELDESIQWPRGPHSLKGVLAHSANHIHHMHVRFKCAPYEKRCVKHTARTH